MTEALDIPAILRHCDAHLQILHLRRTPSNSDSLHLPSVFHQNERRSVSSRTLGRSPLRPHYDTTIRYQKGRALTNPKSLTWDKPTDTPQTDIFTTGATHMAHIHNAILRGYNSIYLQAPHISDADKPAFIGYALTWFRFVKSHHDSEENELFPKVEDVLHRNDIWGATHDEHRMY
jgi:hypothetical protein